MIYTTGTIAISGNTVTGTGTNFSAPLSLIRVGCTLIAIGNPVQIFTITEIKSGTELSVTPAANPAIPAGTKFSILLSDSISVDGLAQDVAETLRYYQGKETEIAAAVEWWNEFGGDGQMDQLLADIRAETAQSTANAQKTESDKNAAAASKTAAANSATAAKASQDAAKASETAASNSKTAAATSATNAAKSAADSLNYRNQAQGIVGNNIGLGASPRDCPDISVEPSGYVGFMRIRGGATGFPSIASGDEVLTGFISVRDTTPTYSGVFVGWVTRSLYTYEWSPQLGPQWTRHARKDEVSRLVQGSGESALWAAGGKQKFVLWDGGAGESIDWGVYDNQQGKWCPLKVAQGGTGGVTSEQARTNLEVMREKKSDLSYTDINTLTGEFSGFYYQGLNSNATTARGYPVSSAGSLLVIRNNANGNAGCTQLYFPYNATTGTFYMRQHIIQSSSSGWEWTAWKKFQSLDFTDSPQFTNLNLVRSSDVATTAGGILQSILNDASGAQRARARFYSEFRGDGKSWATIHLQSGDKNQYAGLSEDGDFSLNSGDFIGRRVRLTANFNYPVEISSAHPTIRFNETDRPSNTPYYSLIFDGGNWRIQKDGYDGTNTSYSMSYNYARDEIEVPNLKVNAIAVPTNLEQTKTNMQIPFAGIAHWVDYNAPTGAEAGKYYPVIVSHPSYYNGDFLVEVAMRTRSISGSEEPNCNAIHLWLRDGGWSDMGAAVFGHYFCYAKNENAILCVRGTDKGQYPHNAIYVRGDAFPIRLAVTVGCNVTIPTADWKPANTADSPTYKWGITNSSDGIDLDTYGISNNLLDFTSSVTGFYCTDTYRNKYGNPYLVVQQNGAIQPANGVEIYSNIDWNTQQSDNVSKFKPIAGNANTPESDLTYGGFHVGFNGTHATQFAGRNSKFFARSFEAGVDKGWCQLATLNASSQRWTGYQQFKSTEFFSDTYTRKVTLAVANSAVRNGELYLWGAESRPTVFEYKIKDPDTNASLSWIFYAQQNTDDSCHFQVNGAVNCVTVNQSSDRDLKDNIQVIGDATEAIRKMNGYTYTLKENGLPYAGVIAQEVMEALPEAVGSFTHYGEVLQGPTIDGNELREETRYLNVDYAAVTGLLVQVARETDNRVTELEEENASLRANIAVMDERITKLEALVRQLTGSEE
ncbi:pyocin knob domain-containing S74 family peptidase [Escherichia coli]|uniref:pyocin knob domain-containing S74 family peptidase n=1 Tax=Escherichia coli TaxID=562 RepID=UPI00244CE08C|nr:pyocin knob domain-containing S74 family peptidase [Escherichia coli]